MHTIQGSPRPATAFGLAVEGFAPTSAVGSDAEPRSGPEGGRANSPGIREDDHPHDLPSTPCPVSFMNSASSRLLLLRRLITRMPA